MPPQRFRYENVEFDTERRRATRDGVTVPLTPTEWKLLTRLCQDAGRLVLNEELLESVWGGTHKGDVAYLRVWISRLRRKLEPTPGETSLIKTMQAAGYRLDASPVE
jgi:two-component system KDP operon response regulator KdpE